MIATLYALALGFFYKDLKIKGLPSILLTSLKQTCGLMFIMSTANFFDWFTIFQRIPDALITQFSALGATPTAFMWIVIAIIIVLGMFLEGNAIFLITLPIFMQLWYRHGEFWCGDDAADYGG